MPTWEAYARVMLELDEHEELPAQLVEMFERAEHFLTLCGGSLRSRQEIAGIIIMYEQLQKVR